MKDESICHWSLEREIVCVSMLGNCVCVYMCLALMCARVYACECLGDLCVSVCVCLIIGL